MIFRKVGNPEFLISEAKQKGCLQSTKPNTSMPSLGESEGADRTIFPPPCVMPCMDAASDSSMLKPAARNSPASRNWSGYSCQSRSSKFAAFSVSNCSLPLSPAPLSGFRLQAPRGRELPFGLCTWLLLRFVLGMATFSQLRIV